MGEGRLQTGQTRALPGWGGLVRRWRGDHTRFRSGPVPFRLTQTPDLRRIQARRLSYVRVR